MVYKNYDFYAICNRLEKTANKTLALAMSMLDEMNDRLRVTDVSKDKQKTTLKSAKNIHKRAKLSPPWNTIRNMLVALFIDDDEITVKPIHDNGDGTYSITLESPNATKVCALSRILRGEFIFGNVTLKIKYAVTNGSKVAEDYNKNDLYDIVLEALASTPAVVDIKRVENFVGDEFIVVEFAKEVVQFYNDDLKDFYGNWNGTFVDVAKEIFKTRSNVMFTVAEK